MKKDWTYKKLGEVGTVITGSTPSTKDNKNYSSQDVCFFKPSDLSSDSLVKLSKSEFYISKHAFEHSRKLPKGSVLTTCIGIIGKVGILTEEATCNQQINAIIPNPDIIISDFLGYSIMSKKHILQASANAPVVPLLNKSQFSAFSIPIPPLSIQCSIVAELDLLHSVISKKKEQLCELDNLAQSLFYQMFGDPITNPMGWEIKKLGEVCGKITDGSHNPPKGVNFSTYRMLSSQNIFNGYIDYDAGVRYLSKENYAIEDKRTNLQVGDVLMTIVGTIGRTCIVSSHDTNVTLQRSVAVLRPNNAIISKYLSYFIMSINSVLNREAHGIAQKGIYLKQLSNFTIPLPPLSLQQSFAAKVSAIEAQKQAVQQSIKEVKALLAQRMDQYFG